MAQVTASALRTLHRILQQLADLNGRLEKGPRLIKAHEGNVAKLEAAMAKASEEMTAGKMTSDQKQLQLRTGEQRIVDLTNKLNACKSNREYQALKEQIAASEMTNSVLADEILEGMDKVDTLESAVAAAKKVVDHGKQEMDKCVRKVAGEKEGLLSEVARLKGELEQAETELPADLVDAYSRVVNAKGEDAMAEVTDGQYCGGCHKQLLPNQVAQVSSGATAVCKPCGRMLYMPEDRTVGSQ
jgi:predicted  nucleic acid-binding Zn-ribbon protein